MVGQQLIRHVLDVLEKTEISYVLVGSFAANVYGIVRATQDMDLVVQAESGQINALASALGNDFQRDPQLQFETVTGTTKTVFKERETGFIIEIFRLSNDPHDQTRFARRRKMEVFGRPTWILSAEDVLVTKLNWLHRVNRTKDLLDVRNVIAVQGNAIDWPYVEGWCDQHGSRPLLEKIRAELREFMPEDFA